MLTALLLASTVPAVSFAPGDGRTYRLLSTLTQSDGAATLHFSAERSITFRRDGDGWSATVTLLSLASDAPDAVRTRYEASVRRTEHVPLVVHLDATGAVTAVDNEEARWTDYQRMIVGLPGSAPGAKASAAELARLLASSMAVTKPEARRALLAGSLTQAIGNHDAMLAPSTDRRIAIPSVRADGRAITITGHQRVSRDTTGLFIHTEGQDDEAIGHDATHMRLTFDRRVDPATGLVMERHDHRETVIGAGPTAHHRSQDTRQQLVPVT